MKPLAENEIWVVKNEFQNIYWDLGIYRWMNRNRNWFFEFVVAIGAFYSGRWSTGESYWPVIYWGISFLTLALILGIDKAIRVNRIKRILRSLSEEFEINITKAQLFEVCKEILPR